ncbi:class I SAM-dependent methyltransferase [Salaquimonas pukyongi]|uniref:class I SAM-dependent methyltransferase n=1 Tax=Salaquimonas pukyongi TaxID=2712698 RepID=UPI0009F8C3E1|nr:class I SAM-dependent methyltransferase [Salaquimonas pukyongi]
MPRDFRHALIAGFERDFAIAPQSGEQWAVFNAHTLPATAIDEAGFNNSLFRAVMHCEQGFRPLFLELQQAGYNAVAQLEKGTAFDHAMLFASRSRAANEQGFRRAWEMVKPGGQILICGEKRSGVEGFAKQLSKAFGIRQRFSKYHALCVLMQRGETPLPETFGKTPQENSHAGLFSAAGPDSGSRLLAGHFSGEISGKVADFGAGWGYLSRQVAKAGGEIASLDLFEADYLALDAARTLLSECSSLAANFHWLDLTAEPVSQRFDWVVMNPPFHQGHAGSRQARTDIGQAFIKKAANCLVKGGKLLMVANRTLPYEETLTKCFSRVEKLAEEEGYKVFKAVR